MIIKQDGRQIQTHKLMMESVDIYQKYQLLNVGLVDIQHERLYGTWGRFGFGTTMTAVFIALFLHVFNPIESLDGLFLLTYWGTFAVSLWAFFRRQKWEDSLDFGWILKEQSKSGYPLRLLPYSTTGNYTQEDYETFQTLYDNAPLSGGLHFEEEPLTEPVLVDSEKVVGAYVEIHLADNGGFLSASQYIMLEDGVGVQVDAKTFRTMMQTIYLTAAGEEYVIPVLTGRKKSILWAAIGDMMESIRAVRENIAKKPAVLIAVFRAAIEKNEAVLRMLEKPKPVAAQDRE